MLSRNLSFFVIVIVILVVLIFFAPAYGWKLRAWLSPHGEATGDNAASVTPQNEILAAQLAEVQSVIAQIPTAPSSTIRAMVFSRYPMNFKDELSVNVGTSEGVVSGKAVLFQGVLIGVVQKVFSDSALVTTVFDPSFKLPVRIGNTGIDALLRGGAYPQTFSIAKNAKIGAGDIIIAAGPGIPYGLPVGTIANLSPSPDDLFDQASLNFAYDINGVETVLIER